MKRLVSVFVAISLAIFGLSASATDGFTYTSLGTPAIAPSGLTVTVTSLQLVDKPGSTQLVVSYTQKNNTADKKLDEGSFKLFFTDGTSASQFGFFGSFFPGDGNSRSYTWEWLKGKEPWLIQWEADFFAAKPTAAGLKWKVGTSFPIATPTPTATATATATPTPTPTPSPTPTSTAPTEPDARPVVAFKWKGDTLNIEAKGLWPKGDQLLIISERGEILWVKNTAGRWANFQIKNLLPQEGLTWESGYFEAEPFIPSRFSTCSQVWSLFDGGLRNSSTSKNKGARTAKTPTTWPKGYQLHKKLDVDKDGIVCER